MDRSLRLVWLWILLHLAGEKGRTEAISAPFHDSNFAPGRDVIVHLFEWKWTDIAHECEKFLGPMKYAGVQVSPPQENAIVFCPESNPIPKRPWYERYQPSSYNLITRSGNETQFEDMVKRCNDVGVRIYVDAVINHMTGDYPEGAVGTGGNPFDSQNLIYGAVPYGPSDFHSSATCPSHSGNIEDYGNPIQVRNCELVCLKDLDHSVENVRDRISDYLNKLLAMGVAGFRVDAAKHMWPQDLQVIYERLNNLNPDIFGENAQPLIYQEVIDMGHEAISSSEYTQLGRVTEFKYGMRLGELFRGRDQLRWLISFGTPWGFVNSEDALVFIDNHDNQRGHGGGGLGTILTFRDERLYKMASAFLLAWPFGLKQIMSSYRWNMDIENNEDKNNWIGPPHDDDFNTLPVTINEDGQCDGDWVCEHRWPVMANMVHFSVVAGNLPKTEWWDNGNNQIAFSRGNAAFFAINNEASTDMAAQIPTGLPTGRYCDVTTGTYVNGTCTGRLFTVDRNNTVFVSLPSQGDSMMALHVEAMTDNFTNTYMLQPPTYDSPSTDYRRTVILIQKQTTLGENVFIRGGISPENRAVCSKAPASCKIPISYTGGIRTPDSFQAWRDKDNFLDWNGAEDTQGKFNGAVASGSPLFYSTNDPENVNYFEFNNYGDNYWVWDVEMDCSKTSYDWFEFKVCQPQNKWESNIYQNGACSGNIYSAVKPFPSNNHVAMCGKINVFHYGGNDCSINDFPY